MKFLLLSGSLRKESLNRKLLSNISQLIKDQGLGEVIVADLKELTLPVYDGDIESVGMPDGVVRLGNLLDSADAFISCSPEYNVSISSPLKNAIDWLSRLKPVPLEKMPVLLTGASPGAFGSIKALGHARAPFETLGSYVFPQTFALPKAHEAFDLNGKLVDASTVKKLGTLISNFKEYAQKLAPE